MAHNIPQRPAPIRELDVARRLFIFWIARCFCLPLRSFVPLQIFITTYQTNRQEHRSN